MKKIYLAALAVSMCISMSSCDSPSKILISRLAINEAYDSGTDYTSKDYADYTYQIRIDGLSDLIESRLSFAFLFEGSSCSSCTSLKPSFMRYVLETKSAFYSLDTDRDSPIDLYEKMMELKDASGNNVFTAADGTPTFMFFNNGVLIEKLPKTTSMNRYGNLSRILNKRLTLDNTTLLINDTQLSEAKNNGYIVFAYNDTQISRLKNLFIDSKLEYYIYHIALISLPDSFFDDNDLDSITTTFRKYNERAIQGEIQLDENVSDEEILNFIVEQEKKA